MRITNCYNCGSEKNTFYLDENGYSLVKCVGCGLLFVANRPDNNQISKAHSQGKHNGTRQIDVTGHFKRRKIPKYLKVLEDLFHGSLGENKTWLDVGCGHGEFIYALQKYTNGKLIVSGTEPNLIKQESARRRGLNVGYFELESHKKKYDYISLLNVYSHLSDPPGFLESLKNLLNQGGEILIETGDTAHFSPKDHVKPLDLPDHLSFASEKIVVSILRRLNLEIISINKYPYLDRNMTSFIIEIVKVFLPHYKSRIRYFNLKKYSENDMYIRARLNN